MTMERRIAELEAKVNALEERRRPGPRDVIVFEVVDDANAPHTPVPQEAIDQAQAEAAASGSSVAIVWQGGGPSPDADVSFKLLGRRPG